MKKILIHNDITLAVERLILEIGAWCTARCPHATSPARAWIVYPVPRGGVPVWYLLQAALAHYSVTTGHSFYVTDDPTVADIFIDDLVDSGNTRAKYRLSHDPVPPWFALFDKQRDGLVGTWLVFPWEGTEEKSVEDAFVRLIQYTGQDIERGGLQETPLRMAKAWKYWTSGYEGDPGKVLKTFEDGAEGYNEMIHTQGIPFYSHCEHHLAPFFGTVTFAYIPNERIVGLSKVNRLVEVFARRLQVQERMTRQILDAFVEHIQPKGAAIVVKARHLCVESRGIQHQGCSTTTSALHGVLLDPAPRAEFFSLSNGGH